MRAGWNPTRRNRNIGTERHGHGQENRLVIPCGRPHDQAYWERLCSPVAVQRTIGACRLTFLVEPTQPGHVHACTIDDVCRVLAAVPPDHLAEIQMIILRQAKRKEALLSPVWGRLAYSAVTGRYRGTAVYLEAQKPEARLRWPRSLAPDRAAELERLRQDGHRIVETSRHHEIHTSLESNRSTQLYRTLLHELGHCVDWLEHVLRPSHATSDPAEDARIRQCHDSKPYLDREAFADRYAREQQASLRAQGVLPFDRLVDEPGMHAEGLDPRWFTLESSSHPE